MITLFYASLLTLLVTLAFNWSSRFKTGTNLGLGEDFGMLQITRTHGNLIENALFFLVLLFLLETVAQIPNIYLLIMGDVFLLARLAHAYGITRVDGKSIFRAIGTLATILVLFVQSIWGMILSLSWFSNNNWGF